MILQRMVNYKINKIMFLERIRSAMQSNVANKPYTINIQQCFSKCVPRNLGVSQNIVRTSEKIVQ